MTEYAQSQGWWVYRTYNSQHSEPGMPDLFMVRPPNVILAELKREKGKVTAAQAKVLALLEECFGLEVHLWRPSDWDEIEWRLR